MRTLAFLLLSLALGILGKAYVDLHPKEPATVRVPVPKPRPYIETKEQYEARLALVKKDVQCLAILVYTEARGEPFEGRRLVAWIGLQRYLDERRDFGIGSLCDVVYKQDWSKSKKSYSSQFAGPVHYGDKINRISWQWRQAYYLALHVYGGDEEYLPPVWQRSARYFYNPAESDSDGDWHKSLVVVVTIKHHIFSRDSITPLMQPLRQPRTLVASN